MRRLKDRKDQKKWNACVEAMAEYMECTLDDAEDFMLAQPAIMRAMPKELDVETAEHGKRT
jgi:predicted DNA-binding protein